MDEIFKEITQIQASEYDLYKLQALNDTLEHYTTEIAVKNANHIEHVTDLFNSKLKSNPNFKKVVDDYVDKYVKHEVKEQAREELFLILTGEMIGLFKGINTTQCSIM